MRWFFRLARTHFSWAKAPLNQPEILECYRLFRYSIGGFKYFESVQKLEVIFKNKNYCQYFLFFRSSYLPAIPSSRCNTCACYLLRGSRASAMLSGIKFLIWVRAKSGRGSFGDAHVRYMIANQIIPDRNALSRERK
jgi:hypothetical protein